MNPILKQVHKYLKTDNNLKFAKKLIQLLHVCFYRASKESQQEIIQIIELHLKKTK